ncbi:transcriptional regulator, TetR family [Fibrobacter sp. UWH5]|uniref:TetR/AcrR family transcriptional regulator n=1 Tax=Fibrobacter sp. UWH5 TaxID=1896211 RepID=UPI0009138FC0|nr:TetR/AcrR family transcriptional regulator [Fibrobacter sp. UWH5]SHL27944.1 transcriptional regulator, TetR family [Fibrobacter sp. UWH5]
MTTKEVLLQQALILFRKEGYDATGVQKIADAAGVGKPTLYHYFGNKRGLLNALLTSHLENFWKDFETAADYNHDVVKTLESVARVYFEFAKNNPEFYAWFMSMGNAPTEGDIHDEVLPLCEKQWTALSELFLAASKDHGNMKGRHQRYAYTFLGIINASIQAYFSGLIKLNDRDVYDTCHQFMHGIFS